MKEFKKLDFPRLREYYTKYPQGYTLYESLLDILEHINEITDVVNLTLNQWEQIETWVLNELKQYSIDQLQSWLDDGTLEEVINETLFESKADKTELDSLDTILSQAVLDIERKGVDVRKFGFVGDNITDDRQSLIDAIDYALENEINKVIIPECISYLSDTVLLPNNINIEGAGSDLTIFDMRDGNSDAFKTVQENVATLTQTSDVLHGHTDNIITNTLKTGDFIRYKSFKRFTESWDGGTAIREYYLNAEMFEIKERTNSIVTFTHPAFLDMPVAQTVDVEAFTPTRNVKLSGFTVRKNRSETGESRGIHIVQAKNVRLKDIKTENFNHAGIHINRSMDVYVEDTKHIGGRQDITGTNYGISVGDGSKNVLINKIYAKEVRHTFAGGGSGWAIPMYVTITNITSENNISHSLDAHGCTAFFTYRNAVVDKGMSISGIGHIVDNVKSKGGTILSYEGGINSVFRNIKIDSLERFYANNFLLDILFENVDLTITHNLPLLNGIKDGSKRITFRDFKLKRVGYGIKATLEELDALFSNDGISYYGIYAREGYTLENVTIEGFPIGLYVGGKNVYVRNLKLINCGWTTSLSDLKSLIIINKNAEYSTIENVRYRMDNVSGYEFGSRTLYFVGNGLGSGQHISVSDVKESPESNVSRYFGVTIPDTFTELFLFNNYIPSSNNSVLGAGKFIKNNFVTDN